MIICDLALALALDLYFPFPPIFLNFFYFMGVYVLEGNWHIVFLSVFVVVRGHMSRGGGGGGGEEGLSGGIYLIGIYMYHITSLSFTL